jgi:hypothetical protein
VKSVNYKLSTSAYWKLGETNVFIIFFPFTLLLSLPPTFPLPPKFLIFLVIQFVSPAGPRRRGRASVRMQTHPRPRLYNPHPRPSFLLFLFFAFGWNCGICLAMPISTCKGRRDHKHFEGDPLAFFAKQKFKGCIYPLDACVFSYAGVYVKIFKRRHRRNWRLFLGICRCHGFFGGWCGPFELH